MPSTRETIHKILALVDDNLDKFNDGEYLTVCKLLQQKFKKNPSHSYDKYYFKQRVLNNITLHQRTGPTVTTEDEYKAFLYVAPRELIRPIKHNMTLQEYVSISKVRLLNYSKAKRWNSCGGEELPHPVLMVVVLCMRITFCRRLRSAALGAATRCMPSACRSTRVMAGTSWRQTWSRSRTCLQR